MLNQTEISGLVTTLASLQRDGEMWFSLEYPWEIGEYRSNGP